MAQPFCPVRRGLVGRMAAAAGAAVLLDAVGLSGCSGPEAPQTVELPLARLPAGGRHTLSVFGQPVEVSRTESEVIARSLLCTHWGCVVRWDDEGRVYRCPCHEGIYDAEGRVISGPPTKPLPRVPATVTATAIVFHRPPAKS